MVFSSSKWIAALSLLSLGFPSCASGPTGRRIQGGGALFRVPSDTVWTRNVFAGQKGRRLVRSWVAGKWVLLETADHFLVGLELQDGRPSFEVEVGQALAFPPTAEGDRIALVTSGRLVLLEGHSGRLLVDKRLDFLPAGPPSILGNSIYLATLEGNRIVSFSARTGREGWSWRSRQGAPSAGPVVCSVQGDVFLVEALDSGTVVGLNALPAETGGPREPLWRARQMGPAGAGLRARKEIAYLASTDTRVYALAGNTGSILWVFPAGSPCLGAPALSGERTYVRAEGNFFCLDTATGRKVWSISEDLAFLSAGPGSTYLVSRKGELVKVEAETGEILERYPTPGMTWTRNETDGTLVGFTSRGLVMAFRP